MNEISDRALVGWSMATCWAIIPPIDWPRTWAESQPTASSTATASAAMSVIVYGPSQRSDRPVSRLSKRTTEQPRASS